MIRADREEVGANLDARLLGEALRDERGEVRDRQRAPSHAAQEHPPTHLSRMRCHSGIYLLILHGVAPPSPESFGVAVGGL